MAGRGLPPLSPEECLDLELWDDVFDDDAASRTSPLRVLARDMRDQLKVRGAPNQHPPKKHKPPARNPLRPR